MSNQGKRVRTHYRGTLVDGTQFDSSYDRGEPLEFVCGAGQMIQGFDAAVENMSLGESRRVQIPANQAYGEYRDDLLLQFPAERVPNFADITVGDKLYLTGPGGQPMPVTVTEKTLDSLTLDANHELAGKDLIFEIELVSIED
ncbi:peptidylprolyl isomerase [Collinsella sp. zg1085]|uniref:FKBP-type peptidyl-prolyl cis-trans isomerase n=1 Tax=Collinsella sp. zg1085 TaxID=2844380 RepID=UPI001C0B2A65|nr:peptidylprolyl isomerase [Collinsella sp. zg1085]QWT17191.1 peptidylprolyl isomerase [Collinsella sp. zg1085]